MHSMTGYGEATTIRNGTRATVQITSVNRKQLDVRVTAPRDLLFVEPSLRSRVAEALHRGGVVLSLSVQQTDSETGTPRVQVDVSAAKSLIDQLRTLAAETGIDNDIRAGDLLSVPGLVAESPLPVSGSALEELCCEAAENAITELRLMQKKEGAALADDLRNRCASLTRSIPELAACEENLLHAFKERLRDRIAELGVELDLDDECLTKEIAFLAERSDISEELTRLQSHLQQMEQVLTAIEPIGRKLDFLCQEIGREITTVGAKIRGTQTACCVLEFKAELGRIREQVQNVE